MPTVKPLSYWRLAAARARRPVVGQPAPAPGPTLTMRGADGAMHTLQFRWGQIVRASATCDPDRDLANLDADPTPLVRLAVVAHLARLGLATSVASGAE